MIVRMTMVHIPLAQIADRQQRAAAQKTRAWFIQEFPDAIYKFRTMTDARDPQGNLLPDEERLTPRGRFLRSTSLDELPELFNVPGVRGAWRK